MHEFSLHGQVDREDFSKVIQQLAGVTRMQPQKVEEIHLIYKGRPPTGLGNLPSAGGSQNVSAQDLQKIKTMLNVPLYFVKLVGQTSSQKESQQQPSNHVGGKDSEITDTTKSKDLKNLEWTLVFYETPDAGKQAITTRFVSKTPFLAGNPTTFIQALGYDYATRLALSGYKFYDQNSTFSLYRPFLIPEASSPDEAANPLEKPISDYKLYDESGSYVLDVSIEVTDGNNPELKDKAIKQLLTFKETLRQSVSLNPADRLALDTHVPADRSL